jgi:serine/threonine-protein kinase
MDTDRNLLFGVLALQADLIDSQQFVEACLLWTSRKDVPLADLLVERGWIVPDDRAHVDYLLGRKLQKHGGDPRAGLAAIPDDVKRSLAALGDDDIQHSLAGLPGPGEGTHQAATVDHVPGPHERYARLHLHATGGIGRVWLARDGALGRDVALKELRPERAGQVAVGARFLQEARITGQLEHPGVVPVYELVRGRDDRQPFYTMRFVKGRTLSEAARAYHQKRSAGQVESLDLLALLNAFVTVCNTVAYAHSRGVIHRDLKGQNVLLGDFGEVVVLDWGLAKRLGRPGGEDPAGADDPGAEDSAQTVQGEALGTPAYMAPEQAAGRLDLIGPRTDVHGLGAILYEVLTGQPPFTGADTHEVLRRVREEDPAPPRRLCPDAPPALEAICLRALAKRPEDRGTDAGGLAEQVQHWVAESAERKQADQQRARFFALSLDLMCIAGFDGYFKQLNPAWEKTLGWTLTELQARPWLEFLHPDDVAPSAAAAQRIIAGEALTCHENRYRCKDGSYRWLQWTAQEIVGQQLMYAMARDVTDSKRAEEALRAGEERYRSVIAAMHDGVAILDADGSIRECNAAAERILGLSADQMRGRTPLDPRWGAIREDGSPFPDEDRPPVVTLRTGRPCPDVAMGVHKPDGTLTWITVNAEPLFQADGRTLAGVVASFEDITGRKRTEELLRQTAEQLACCRQQLQRLAASAGQQVPGSSPSPPGTT